MSLLPQDLVAARRWMTFVVEPDVARPGKLAKRPFNGASSTDAATWSSFEDAEADLELGRGNTLGFALGDGYAGIDLDDVRNPASGGLTAEAQRLLARFPGAYAEVSPSGRGVKLFLRRNGAPVRGRKFDLTGGGHVEFYAGARFFTVTGDALGEVPERLEPTDEFDALLKELEPHATVETPPSNESRHDQLLRLSVKLGELPPTTILTALRAVAATMPGPRIIEDAELRRMAETAGRFSATTPEQAEPYPGVLAELIAAKTYPPRELLLPGVALGERTLNAGAPGSGKSVLEIHVALCLALGLPILGQWQFPRPLRVALQLEEDSTNLSELRVHRMLAGLGASFSDLGGRLLLLLRTGYFATTPGAQARIQRTLQDHGTDVWILDSITQCSGIEKQGDAPQVRAFFREHIEPIVDALGLTVLVAHHTTKGVYAKQAASDDEALVSGSIQFAGSVDNALLLRKAKDGSRVLQSLKSRDQEEPAALQFDLHDDYIAPPVHGRPPLQLAFRKELSRDEASQLVRQPDTRDRLAELLADNAGQRFTYERAGEVLGVTAKTVAEAASFLEANGRLQRSSGGGRGKRTEVWLDET